MKGWLVKQGPWVKNWKRRWFVLTTEDLTYSKTEEGSLQGVASLDDTFSAEYPAPPLSSAKPKAADTDAGSFLFFLDVKGSRKYLLKAATAEERDDWIEDINNLRRRLPGFGVCLDDFRILSVIGSGGFGKVVLAKAKEDGKLFALKVMSKQAIKQQDKVDQVLLERDISKPTNDHPFLVGLCFAFHTMSSVYIGMEFVQGGELFTLLVRKRWLPEDEARFYLAEIALGIDHLHKQGIVWRDLKPENVLNDRYDRPRENR
jgi:hypothetical protein